MYSLRVCAVLVFLAAVGVLSAQAPSSPGGAPGVLSLALTTEDVSPLREWDGRLNRMLRDGDVELRTHRVDTVLTDRTHERYDQYVRVTCPL